jgi:hypothetical protein
MQGLVTGTCTRGSDVSVLCPGGLGCLYAHPPFVTLGPIFSVIINTAPKNCTHLRSDVLKH